MGNICNQDTRIPDQPSIQKSSTQNHPTQDPLKVIFN